MSAHPPLTVLALRDHLTALMLAVPDTAVAPVYALDERFGLGDGARYSLTTKALRIKRRRDKARTPELIIG